MDCCQSLCLIHLFIQERQKEMQGTEDGMDNNQKINHKLAVTVNTYQKPHHFWFASTWDIWIVLASIKQDNPQANIHTAQYKTWFKNFANQTDNPNWVRTYGPMLFLLQNIRQACLTEKKKCAALHWAIELNIIKFSYNLNCPWNP